MRTLTLLTAGIIGYLLGSINVAVILSRCVFGNDVRKHGSGNAGATNVARVFGIRAGLLTFAGDVLKTAFSLLIGSLLAGIEGSSLAAACCVIGHCFPLYFHFRGGKGVSVGAAISAFMGWQVILVVFAVFTIVSLCCRKVSLASLCSAVALPVTMFILGGYPWFQYALGIGTALLLIFMHRSNIRRLIAGTESDFKPAENRKK